MLHMDNGHEHWKSLIRLRAYNVCVVVARAYNYTKRFRFQIGVTRARLYSAREQCEPLFSFNYYLRINSDWRDQEIHK